MQTPVGTNKNPAPNPSLFRKRRIAQTKGAKPVWLRPPPHLRPIHKQCCRHKQRDAKRLRNTAAKYFIVLRPKHLPLQAATIILSFLFYKIFCLNTRDVYHDTTPPASVSSQDHSSRSEGAGCRIYTDFTERFFKPSIKAQFFLSPQRCIFSIDIHL